jgi:hypothetical protein
MYVCVSVCVRSDVCITTMTSIHTIHVLFLGRTLVPLDSAYVCLFRSSTTTPSPTVTQVQCVQTRVIRTTRGRVASMHRQRHVVFTVGEYCYHWLGVLSAQWFDGQLEIQ